MVWKKSEENKGDMSAGGICEILNIQGKPQEGDIWTKIWRRC